MPPGYQSFVPEPPDDSKGLHALPASSELAEFIRNVPLPPPQAESDEQQLRALPRHPHGELNQAIESGDAKWVLSALASARRFNDEGNLHSAIQHAIQCRQFHIMCLLLENDVSASTDDLEAAARSGNISILSHLTTHLQWQFDTITAHGLTVLTCVYADLLNSLRLLTPINTRLAVEHAEMVSWLLARGANINLEDEYGESPLSRAVQRGPISVVNMLLEAGADVTQGAPLQASLLRKEGNENLELTQDLLARGAPVDKFLGEDSPIWKSAGFEQMTALHVACDGSHRNLAAVRLLLAHGANPMLNRRAPDRELPNTSPIESARSRGYVDIVSAMQEHMKHGRDCMKSSL